MGIALILIGLLTYHAAATDGPSQPSVAAAFIILTIFAALLTANLLFGQFLSARVPSLAVLGGIYLYVSLINIPYLLTLPKSSRRPVYSMQACMLQAGSGYSGRLATPVASLCMY